MKANGSITQLAVLPSLPTSMTYNPVNDMLYITYASQCIVLSISQTGLVLPLAGGTCGTADGKGSAAQFQSPQGITVDPVKAICTWRTLIACVTSPEQVRSSRFRSRWIRPEPTK